MAPKKVVAKKAKAPAKPKPRKRFAGDMSLAHGPDYERPSIDQMRLDRQLQDQQFDAMSAKDRAEGKDIYNDVPRSGRMARAQRRMGTGGYIE